MSCTRPQWPQRGARGALAYALIATILAGTSAAWAAVNWVPLAPVVHGRMAEARLEGLPASTNVFDPDQLAVDVVLTSPGGNRKRVPAFWYQAYTRRRVSGREQLTADGAGEWRVRWWPEQPGPQAAEVRWTLQGGAEQSAPASSFEVAPAPAGSVVSSGVAVAEGGQFFVTREGAPLPLVGGNVCWPGERGTADYEEWFPAMAGSGWNWARLWMSPWAFGIENAPGERLNYRLDRAWQLDRVFELAGERGLRLLLCLEYHGMFAVNPDGFGGNNRWPEHPYNRVNGGPLASPREFFTSEPAARLFQKRLRYLIARYGAHPSLMAWQFFNEIDNVYSLLNPAEVAAWHGRMGRWLRAQDPWQRLITTSLTGGSDRPEIWSLPEMEFAVYHSYNETSPADRLGSVVEGMRRRYRKPVLVGEAGVDWRGWSAGSDPHLRGFRQLLWGGVVGGSAGTAMSWWWESIHSSNAYPLYQALTNVVTGSSWGTGPWERVQFRAHAPMPAEVGERIPGRAPVTVQLTPAASWGTRPSGQLAVVDAGAAEAAPQRLNAFVHGSAHPELRAPFRLNAWLAANARLVVKVNSVSQGAVLAVRSEGREVFRRSLPDRDGRFEVNGEYNEEISIDLPAGRQTVELLNAGGDWFYVDWVRLEQVEPAAYAGDWRPAPSAHGVRHDGEALLYVVAPGLEYPSSATVAHPPVVSGVSLVASNFPAGDFAVLWFSPRTGQRLARHPGKVGGDGLLNLTLPDFNEDLAAHVFRPPALRAARVPDGTGVRLSTDGPRGPEWVLEESTAFAGWSPAHAEREDDGSASEWLPAEGAGPRFFRLRQD